MTRVKRGSVARKRRKKMLKMSSGYFGSRSKLFRNSKESVQRALCYSYRDRKVRKRFFRRLWILRINAFVRNYDTKYSNFMNSIKKSHCIINRKTLASLTVFYPDVVKQMIVESMANEG
jgi:large subunit ribosomal protein L20